MTGFPFDVVELPETDRVGVGDTAPDFTRPLVDEEGWSDAALSELPAPVLLVFYPMNDSGKATYLWTEIAARGWADELTVVGVTISTPYDHMRFIRERGLSSALFSDPANGVAEAYGVAHDLDDMAGLSEPRPAVFLLDGERTVRYAWVADEWPVLPDYDEVEAAVERA